MVYRDIKIYQKTLAVASVAAHVSAEQTFTVTGLDASRDVVLHVHNDSISTNAIGIGGARVSADDTLAINFCNPDASSAVDPANTGTGSLYTIVVGRTGSDPSADGDRL
jgi:hypothetical protein